MRLFLALQPALLVIAIILGFAASQDGLLTGPPGHRVLLHGVDAFWTVAPAMFIAANGLLFLALITVALIDWAMDR